MTRHTELDPVQRAVADSRAELADDLARAHLQAVAQVDRDDIAKALRKGSPQAVYSAFGMAPDGSDWPALRHGLANAMNATLAAVHDAVALSTLYRHKASSAHFNEARDDFDAAYATAITAAVAQILADTLDGMRLAIELATQGKSITVRELLASVGLTRKQVTLFAAITRSADKLQNQLTKATGDDERASVSSWFLATLPAMIATQLRRKLLQAQGKFGPREFNTLMTSTAQTYLAHRFRPLADFIASSIAHLAEQSAHVLAQRLGLIAADTRKYWITRDDELVRHSHAQVESMNAEGVPLNGLFRTPTGHQLPGPPYERNCRCRVSLEPPR